jgi:hypothetical protein
MPDSNNLPTTLEILDRILTIESDASESTQALVPGLLSAVVAHFQSPPGAERQGGTGRTFVPVFQTRFFDGNGLPELRVDDIVPGAALAVSVYGTLLSDVLLKTAGYGLGSNILTRPQGGGFAANLGSYYGGIFPQGKQNIAVATTWGAQAGLTDDIREAILGEVAYRALVLGELGLTGVGEDIKMEGFELNTSVGAINFTLTSPLTVMHTFYLNAVTNYRVSKMEMKRYVRVMS